MRAGDRIDIPRGANGRFDLAWARSLQEELRGRVEIEDRLEGVRFVAGADVSYDRGGEVLFAAVVVLDAATLATVETATRVGLAAFPYVPGYLSFREAPQVIEAFAKLRTRPGILLVDGHGLAHPRRFGLACHLGVVLDVPAVGVAKSVLVGEAQEPAAGRGSRAPLLEAGRCIGAVLRTRDGVAPVYVSVGHRVSLPTAVRWVLRCGGPYRLPEPTRRAHLEVNALRARSRSKT